MAGATGLTALAAAVVSGGTAVAMNIANPADAWALLATRPPFAVAYLVSVVVLALVGTSAVRTVRAARRTARRPRPTSPRARAPRDARPRAH